MIEYKENSLYLYGEYIQCHALKYVYRNEGSKTIVVYLIKNIGAILSKAPSYQRCMQQCPRTQISGNVET